MPETGNRFLDLGYTPTEPIHNSGSIKSLYLTPSEGGSKYDTGFNPEYNNNPYQALENFRGENKPWYDYTGDLLMRVPALTGAKLATGIGLIGGGLKGLVTGEGFFHEAYNNELTKASEWLEKEINNQYPVYHTNEYDAMNPLRKIFTPEWLSEQGADMAAFSLSTMIPALGIGKLATIGMEAVGASDAVWLAKMGKLGMQSTKFREGVGLGLASALSSSTEALFESKSIYDNALKEGKTEEEAVNQARKSYLANVAILSVSNTWELKQILGGYNNTRKLAKGLLDADGNVIKNTWKNSFKEIAKNSAQGVFVEGVWEENVQHAIEKWSNDVIKGQADGDISSGLNEITKNYFNNFTDKEGLENILGGAVMGIVMGGGVGTYQETKSKNALANKFSQNFKKASKEYNIDKYREDVAKLKKEYHEKKQLQSDLNKVKDNKEFIDAISKILNLTKSQDLQDYLASLDLEELYNYTRDTALAKLSHSYITSGMTDHLLHKMEAAKKLTEADKQVFGNIADVNNPTELAAHITNLMDKVKGYDKTFDKVDNLFGWQTHITEDKDKNKVKQQLFDTGNIYMNTVRRDNAVERIKALNLKQLELEGKFLSNQLLDNLGELDKALPQTIDTARKLAKEGNLEAIDYLKNNAQIKVLKNQHDDAIKKLTDLTNPKKSRQTIDKLKEEGQKEAEDAISNPNKTTDPFQLKIEHLAQINNTGKLFYNGKPGTINIQQDKGKVWFNPDDKSSGIQITEANIDDFINQAKTPEQLEEDKNFEIEKNAQLAKIKTLEKLLNTDTEEFKLKQSKLNDINSHISEKKTELVELSKILRGYKGIKNEDIKRLKKSIRDLKNYIGTLESSKDEIQKDLDNLKESIIYLRQELEEAKQSSDTIDEVGMKLLESVDKLETKTLPEATQLVIETQSFIDELSQYINDLKSKLGVLNQQFTDLMRLNDAIKLIAVVYNKSFKSKYPGVFKLLNPNILNDILEHGIKDKYTNFEYFQSYDELKEYILGNSDFLQKFSEILKERKKGFQSVIDDNIRSLSEIKNQSYLTQNQLDELYPALYELAESLRNYEGNKDLISRSDNFFKNYKRLTTEFGGVLDNLNKETVKKYNSYLGIDNKEFNENPEQLPQETNNAVQDSFNYGRKDSILTTSGRDNTRNDRVITQLDPNYHYHLKIIAVDSDENLNPENNYLDLNKIDTTPEGKVLKGEKEIDDYYREQAKLEGKKWHPLKAILVYGNGNDVLADEKGNIVKDGKPVTFYLHKEEYVDKLDQINLTINWLATKGLFIDDSQLDESNFKEILVVDNKEFHSAKELIDYVVKEHKDYISLFRESIYNQLKEGKQVFVEVNDKSNGVQIKSNLKSIIGSFVGKLSELNRIIIPYETASNQSKGGYVQVQIADNVYRFLKVGFPVIVNNKNQIISGKNTTLSDNDADFIIKLLNTALGNPNDRKVTVDGTDGNKYYILPNKQTKNSIISRLILWNSDPKKGLDYHISFNKGRILYGYDKVNKSPYIINTTDLINNPNLEHFRNWLKTKYFNVNKNLLSLDTYSHPVGFTEDGKIEMKVFNRMEGSKKLGAYERMLIEENKLLTDLPELGENQFKSIYLKYNPTIKNSLTTKAPVKPKEESKPQPQFETKSDQDFNKTEEEKQKDQQRFDMGVGDEGSSDVSEFSGISQMLQNAAPITTTSESSENASFETDEDAELMNRRKSNIDTTVDDITKTC